MRFFFRLFLWFSIRHMRHHLGRAAAVMFGVALGAAVFTSVRLAIHASVESFTRSMTHITGRAEHGVTRPGGLVPESLVVPLLKHPAVKAASPLLSTYVRISGDKTEPFLLIGIDPMLDRPLRNWRLQEAPDRKSLMWLALLQAPDTLIAGRRLAERNGWRAGDAVMLEYTGRSRPFRIVGVLAPEGLALAESGIVAVTDIATFQEFTGRIGEVDRIDLLLDAKAGPLATENLRRRLPDGVALQGADAWKESGKMMIRSYQLNLSILSFASLFVGMFLVYSLVALNAATRRKELAILRATGASSKVIFGLFISEGLLLGLLGWMLAVPLSAILMKYMLHGVGQTISTLFVRVHAEEILLSGWEVLLSFGITIFISVLAAFQPALEAMRTAPREILSLPWHHTGRKDTAERLAVAGVVMIAAVLPLARIQGPPGVPVPGYAATVFLFAGFSLLAPRGLRLLGRITAPPLRAAAGIPAYLAGRYVRDSGTRTAVSVGALITAVALYTALVIMIYSFRETVKIWVEQTVTGDLFVAAKMAEINQFREPLSASTQQTLQRLETPADIVPSRRFQLTYGRVPYQFEAMDIATFLKYGDFIPVDRGPPSVPEGLIDGGGVLVSEVFSNRTGLRKGDRFHAVIRSVRIDVPVLGVIRDYRTRGGVVFCDMALLERHFPDLRWTGARFFLRHRNGDPSASVSALRREILDKCGHKVDMLRGRQLRTSILRIFDETFAVTTVLLIIALGIAALGIATTLTVLVLERTRQLNTLYAVGAGFGQIRAMILWEALLMITAGQCAGLGCGFILSHLLIFVVNRQSFGWTFLYRVDWQALVWSLPLIACTAVVAALPALRTVFREPPATLLRER